MNPGYYHTEESVKEYIQLAKDVNGKHLIEKMKLYLSIYSTILELGTGPGTDWDLLRQEFHVIGSDNSEEFLNHLQSSYPDGNFLLLDAVTLETDKRFDALYSNKVLHHLKDEELRDSVERQHSVLNEGGIVCHSFWKGEGTEIFKGMFVNYHTESSLREFFGDHFDILKIEPFEEFEADDSLMMIARKKSLKT